jgi:hypothetical protein
MRSDQSRSVGGVVGTVEDAADLGAEELGSIDNRPPRPPRGVGVRRLDIRLSRFGLGLGLAGKLMAGVGVALAAGGASIALAHAAPARSADAIFVPGREMMAPTASQPASPDPSTSVVMSPGSGQVDPPGSGQVDPPGRGQSQESTPARPGPDQTPEPNAGGGHQLNDGLSDDPGQPQHPDASQDPNSNG